MAFDRYLLPDDCLRDADLFLQQLLASVARKNLLCGLHVGQRTHFRQLNL